MVTAQIRHSLWINVRQQARSYRVLREQRSPPQRRNKDLLGVGTDLKQVPDVQAAARKGNDLHRRSAFPRIKQEPGTFRDLLYGNDGWP
jgi:hypothetical protein